VLADILLESDHGADVERYGPLAQAARAQRLVQTERTAEEIRALGRRAPRRSLTSPSGSRSTP
jgi:hypothetical protein